NCWVVTADDGPVCAAPAADSGARPVARLARAGAGRPIAGGAVAGHQRYGVAPDARPVAGAAGPARCGADTGVAGGDDQRRAGAVAAAESPWLTGCSS